MSQEAAKTFLSMLEQDATLKAQVKGIKGAESTVLPEIVTIGAARKLSFTSDELKAAAKATQSKLSEKELDKVAGGGCKVILLSVGCCSG